MVLHGRHAVLLLALMGVVPGFHASASAQERPSGGTPLVRPSGTVLDRQTETPVATARVVILHPATLSPLAAGETDSAGAFTLTPIPGGTYFLRVERIGYQPLEDTLTLAPSENDAITVYLVPEAIDLEPVVVTTARTTAYYMRDFERRRATGSGIFITREQIQHRRPNSTSELLQNLAGVRVVRTTRGDAALFMRGTCRPQLFVDGAALYGDVSIDTAVLPDDIEGIEVYSDAGIPIQYAIRAPCGAILVWTRPAVQVARKNVSRWKLLAAGGVFFAVFLLTR